MRKGTLPPVTAERIERLCLRVSLQVLSTFSGVSMTILSEAERGLRGLTDQQEAARRAALRKLGGDAVVSAPGESE